MNELSYGGSILFVAFAFSFMAKHNNTHSVKFLCFFPFKERRRKEIRENKMGGRNATHLYYNSKNYS